MNLKEYAEYAIAAGATCCDCGGAVTEDDLRNYAHVEGWEVDGFSKRQWLYFECPGDFCGYYTSLARLGIPVQNFEHLRSA